MLACNTKSKNIINLHLCMPKIICTLNRHLLFTSLFIFLLSSATIWRGIWRALPSWRRLSQNIPSKIQKIIQENLSKSKHCVPVRQNPSHSPPKTKLTGATLNFG